jgi:hypothetical protein
MAAPTRRAFTRGALAGLLSAAVASAAVLVPASSANAAITNQTLVGSAGATYVSAVGGVVTSGLTSASHLNTTETGRTRSNSAADLAVAGLATTDAVSTQVTTSAITGGKRVDSTARVTNVDVLSGVVTADAVETTSTVSVVDGIATPTGGTTFVGLQVAGQAIPVDVKKNLTINVPGVAKVVVNASTGTQLSDATARQRSVGLQVTLLTDVGNNAAGTTVLIAPTTAAALTPNQSIGEPVGGIGYSTRVFSKVDGAVRVYSGPTAAAAMPAGGTAGKDVTNSTVGVKLKTVLNTGVLTSTVNGSRTPLASRSTVTSEATDVNLLAGLITADAVTARGQAAKAVDQPVQLAARSQFVNLVIAGRPIPVEVGANTEVTVPGLVKVTLNQQIRTATGVTVRGLDVEVIGAGLGLPVGSKIEVATANAWVVSRG